jgi:GTP-binding protein
VAELIAAIARSLPGVDELGTPAEPAGVVVHRLGADRDSFSVDREDGAYRVRGRRIERLVAQTDFENEESAARFQRDLERFGIERELRRAGVASGDLVRIGAHELEWDAEPWE